MSRAACKPCQEMLSSVWVFIIPFSLYLNINILYFAYQNTLEASKVCSCSQNAPPRLLVKAHTVLYFVLCRLYCPHWESAHAKCGPLSPRKASCGSHCHITSLRNHLALVEFIQCFTSTTFFPAVVGSFISMHAPVIIFFFSEKKEDKEERRRRRRKKKTKKKKKKEKEQKSKRRRMVFVRRRLLIGQF